MIKHKLWRPVKKNQIVKRAKTLGSLSYMKKKAGRSLQGILTVHQCSQKNVEHYDSSLSHPPIPNDAVICIIVTLMLMVIRKYEPLI